MKNLMTIVILSISVLLIQYFLPWWTLIFPCSLFGFLYGNKAGRSFLIGFLSVALAWLAVAFWIRLDAGPALSDQVAGIFPGKSVAVLFALTGLIGGLAGGLTSWTGYELRRMI